MIWTLILGVVLIFSAYYALSLIFHWMKYGFTLPLVWLVMPIYLAGSAFLILLVFSAYAALV